MIVRGGDANKILEFHVGDMVTLQIPRVDRLSAGVKRLICRIMQAGKESFTLMSEYGIIKRACVAREIELVPTSVTFRPKKGSGSQFVTIMMVAKRTENERLGDVSISILLSFQANTRYQSIKCNCRSECQT